jgi:cell fate (sporulation/competence/biofilm development) regulator YlbF (YheA/YmcA/DUF963 family)
MDNRVFDDIEIAPPSVVRQAACDFAAALAATQQFKAFEKTAECFRQDQTAQQAMEAYQQKQQSLQALLMLNALSDEQRSELEQLHSGFINQPVAQDYLQAQTELVSLCQALGDVLSEATGLNYSAACKVSCCGEVAGWAGQQLRYSDLFDADCPPVPAGAELPLALWGCIDPWWEDFCTCHSAKNRGHFGVSVGEVMPSAPCS